MTSLAQDKKKTVQNAVKGSLKELTVIEGGNNGDNRDIPPEEVRPPEETCPVQPLGHLNGIYSFLDAHGQFRQLTTSQLAKREELIALFGDCGQWLKGNFPHWAKDKKTGMLDIVDFDRKNSSDWFNMRCTQEGLFGNHIKIRNTGVWMGEKTPIVHCGDKILIEGKLKPSGIRVEDQIFASYPPIKKPSEPVSGQLCFDLQKKIHELWNFKTPKSSMIVMGWLACALLGASINWKPALFLIGSAGTGKSTLLRTILNCCPVHLYTNDATKAGLEQAMEGRAIPSFIDEAADNLKDHQVQKIMDMILAASGKEGSNSLRGGSDGKWRFSSVSAAILLASISPPNMQEQHMGRFTLVELLPATKGNDFTQKHDELQEWCKKHATGIWGRVLNSYERFHQTRIIFRKMFSETGSDGRENDQLSSLLSGWWILCQDGIPDEKDASRWIKEISGFIKDKEDISDKSEVSQCLDILVSSWVQVGRSTDRRPISKLILQAVTNPKAVEKETNPDMFETTARQALENIGIRVIGPYEPNASNGSLPPRPDGQEKGAGIWIWPKHQELKKFYKETPYADQRLERTLSRAPSAFVKKQPLKIGSVSKRNCIWISTKDLQLSLGDLEDDNAPF
ncbi:ATP-binding protein [Acetobacteraceae bacterium]|nr:ATP-binding protein [Acetobacteraceae bacterium]